MDICRVSTAEIVKALESVREAERSTVARNVLETLYPSRRDLIDRLVRRLDHPEIPDDFWEAVDELEAGQGIEMRDVHFEQPPA